MERADCKDEEETSIVRNGLRAISGRLLTLEVIVFRALWLED